MNKEFLKTMIFITVTVGFMMIALFTPVGKYFTRDSIINYIKPLIAHNKVEAVSIFIVAMIVLPMVWVPRLIMTAVSGVLFGIKEGFIYAMIGSTLAGIIGYYFAREFTSKYFSKKIEGKSWVKYLDFTKSNAFLLILYSRICPITHYEVINYLCGTSNIKFSTFFWPTFFGIIPGTFVYVWMGDVILKYGWFSKEAVNVLLILGIFLALTSYGFYRVIKGDKSDEKGIKKNNGEILAIILFSIFTILYPTFSNASERVKAKVLYVIDGDTVQVFSKEIGGKKSIRFLGIDSPETQHGRKFKGGQPYGEKAKIFLKNLIDKKNVIIDVTGNDRYGRVLGEIYYKNQNINELMVKEGLAYAYAPRGEKPPVYDIKAERYAKKHRKGLWNTSTHIRPKFYRKYWLLRRMFSDYHNKTMCKRWIGNKKLVYFILDKNKKIDDEIKYFKKKLYLNRVKFIPIPYLFNIKGKNVLGFEVKKLNRKSRKSFSYYTLEQGNYCGIIDLKDIPESRLDNYIKTIGSTGEGKYFKIIWITLNELRRNNYPEDKPLYELIRRVK